MSGGTYSRNAGRYMYMYLQWEVRVRVNSVAIILYFITNKRLEGVAGLSFSSAEEHV